MKRFKKSLAMLLALCLMVSLLPATALASATGSTTGEPFAQGTGGSNSFRIPALVTTSDGTLVAAADARWNTTYDGGGLDTIVSRSDDDGATWNYTFANYLDDNGDVYDGDASTAFIDPALAVTKNDTIYMLVDLYPYGVALNGSGNTAPVTTKGFNDDGYLLLSGNNHSSYGYYLKDGLIYDSSNNEVEGYTVDGKFNLYYNGEQTSNLFFKDSPYKVVRTGFLYLTKSTDDGATWSDPELLNLKTSSEQVCLVAPGRGLVTDNGNIIFPVYSYNGSQSSQTMSFISMDADTGAWSRSTNMTGASWSSESAVVTLENGALRFFYRNGTTNLCYVDYNNGWGTPVVMSGIDTNSNCQISAITYSKTIDGKQVILVSCPTGPNEAGSDQSGASYRLNGKIFAFTVESDGSMTNVGSVNVTSNNAQFMYSCLTELTDGTVGILYEDKENAWGEGSNCYYTMSYGEYDLTTDMGLSFDEDVDITESVTVSDKTTDVSVSAVGLESVTATKLDTSTPLSGYTVSVTYDVLIDNGAYTGEAEIKIPYDNIFDDCVEIIGHVPGTNGDDTFDVEVKDGYFVGKVPHFTSVTISGRSATVTSMVDVRIPVGGTSETYTDTTGNYEASATIEDSTVATMHVKDITGTGAASYSQASDISSGKQYLITIDGNHVVSNNFSNSGYNNYYWRDASGLYIESVDDIDINNNLEQYLWTITQTETGYTIQDKNGQYLNIAAANNSVTLSSTLTNVNIRKNSSGTFDFYNGDYYLNDFGDNNLFASSWENGASGWTLYEYSAGSVSSTEISFAGVKAGTTTAVVGTTQYNIIVYETKDITVNYQVNGTTVATGTLTVTSDATTATLPNTVVDANGNTYAVNNTTLDLTVVPYNVSVTLKEGEDISVAVRGTVEIKVELSEGQYVKWETEDDHYASVAGVYDTVEGAYTDTAVVVGNNETEDNATVLVTGTVYNADGSVAGVYKWLVTVTEATSTNTTSKYVYIDIPRIQNCTVYYAVNAGELIEITDDMLDGPYTDDNGTYYKLKAALVDEQYTGGYQISFFAKPDEGYALTYMSSTNSAGEYYVLSDGDNPDGTDSSAWPFVSTYDWSEFDSLSNKPAGGNTSVWHTDRGLRWGLIEGNFTVAQLRVMLTNALAMGCDGTLVFTKNNSGTTNGSSENDLVTDLAFIAEKLPEMYKVLSKVSYVDSDGNTVYVNAEDVENIGIGYTLHYTIYVAMPTMAHESSVKEGSGITYNDFVLTDELTDDIWSSNEMDSEVIENSFTWNGSTVNVTEYTSADTWKNPLTDGSVTTFPVDSFTYTNSAGKSVTYTDSTSNVYAFNSTLTLGASNFLNVVADGTITNTAELKYDYQGSYSNGALAWVSNAVVDVLVEVPEYVIDFGLPVEIDLDNDPLVEGDVIVAATAKYGDVYITADRKLLYVPTTILKDSDFITLTFADGGVGSAIIGYGVRIYPATSVYYDESIINNGWTTNGNRTDGKAYTHRKYTLGDDGVYSMNYSTETVTGIITQESAELGDVTALDSNGNPINADNYGYDDAYAEVGTNSGYIIGEEGAYTSFTFTGTGFQLYGNSTDTSGYVTVYSKGNLNKLYMINTVLSAGESDATKLQSGGTYYGLPFISETNLPYGTYTVQIKQTKGDAPIYLDGVRIFNTINDETVGEDNIYYADREDNPDFYEVRDFVLNALGVQELDESIPGNDSEYTDSADRAGLVDSVKDMAGQVYNAIAAGGASAVIMDGSVKFDATDAQDLLDNGPKNELYLYKDQTLIFKVKTDRVVQLGLKAPTGTASFTLNNDTEKTLKTSVDMFYEVAAKEVAADGYTVTIKNTGDDVLSVTLLKICDDPNATFTALTQEDIENVLLDMYGLAEEPVVYADATLNIAVNDDAGNALATTQLTANGIEGEEATFAAADIQAAVEALELPDKYNLSDTTYSDVTVAYGDEDSVAFVAEKEQTTEEKVVEAVKEIITSITNLFKKWFRW